jgi:hypothetical protein
VLHVDVEGKVSAQTNLYSSYVAAKTCLSNRAQLMRRGRAWTVSALQDAPEARPLARHEQFPGLFVSTLGLDEARQLVAGAGLGAGDEAGRVLLGMSQKLLNA